MRYVYLLLIFFCIDVSLPGQRVEQFRLIPPDRGMDFEYDRFFHNSGPSSPNRYDDRLFFHYLMSREDIGDQGGLLQISVDPANHFQGHAYWFLDELGKRDGISFAHAEKLPNGYTLVAGKVNNQDFKPRRAFWLFDAEGNEVLNSQMDSYLKFTESLTLIRDDHLYIFSGTSYQRFCDKVDLNKQQLTRYKTDLIPQQFGYGPFRRWTVIGDHLYETETHVEPRSGKLAIPIYSTNLNTLKQNTHYLYFQSSAIQSNRVNIAPFTDSSFLLVANTGSSGEVNIYEISTDFSILSERKIVSSEQTPSRKVPLLSPQEHLEIYTTGDYILLQETYERLFILNRRFEFEEMMFFRHTKTRPFSDKYYIDPHWATGSIPIRVSPLQPNHCRDYEDCIRTTTADPVRIRPGPGAEYEPTSHRTGNAPNLQREPYPLAVEQKDTCFLPPRPIEGKLDELSICGSETDKIRQNIPNQALGYELMDSNQQLMFQNRFDIYSNAPFLPNGKYDLLSSFPHSVGCIYTDTLRINLQEEPLFDLAYDSRILCPGDTVLIQAHPDRMDSVAWYLGEERMAGTQDLHVTEAGTYEMEAFRGRCSLKESIRIVEGAVLELQEAVDTTLPCDGHLVLQPQELQYDFNSIFWSSGGRSNELLVEEPGYYESLEYGDCVQKKTEFTVRERECYPDLPKKLFIPNVFSPNNDGINDYFPQKDLQQYPYQLKIFDRNGQLIYEGHQQAWNGRARSMPAQEGVYVYRISIYDRVFSGAVTLLR